jgi:hypothetical protein
LYELAPGHVIFHTRADMIRGLQDSVISVCFPSSMTHPQRSGDVETLTQRYLESICAGTVVFGSAPAELVELFGYDPVIEARPGSELTQLQHILSVPSEYQGMVERNFQRLLEVGTWSRRADDILTQLVAWGFATSPTSTGDRGAPSPA